MDHITFRGNTRQKEAIKRAADEGLADNESDAARMLIDQGAADLGILNGNGVQSKAENRRLNGVLQEASELAAYVGLAWGLMLTLFPESTVNWAILSPVMLALVVIVSKNLFVKYG